MSASRLTLSVVVITALLGGCGDTGQARTTIPISVAGTAPEAITVGDWDVTVREARLAFGPVYLCSAQNAGLESCGQAAAEHLGATSFDALAPTPTPMGTMTGITGVTVLSGMWDYGRTWRLPDVEPRPLHGAIDGQHSAILEVVATHDDGTMRAYRFVLDVDGGTQPSGSTAARTRLPAHELSPSDTGLVVRFDPTLWASMIDYDALARLPEPGPGATTVVPAGHTAFDALTIALTATALPSFEWQ
jgi:hypothetical protein